MKVLSVAVMSGFALIYSVIKYQRKIYVKSKQLKGNVIRILNTVKCSKPQYPQQIDSQKVIFDTNKALDYFNTQLSKYGFGSCGPRGFLGTFTSHLMLEKDLGDYFDSSSIIFPSFASVIESALITVLPDYVICFKNCSPEILRLSESQKVISISSAEFVSQLFSPELTQLLSLKMNGWVVFDSTSLSVELLNVCSKFKLRSLMNEKGFLQLGKCKRGTTEEINENAKQTVISNRDIDLITVSFEELFGIPGGACSGSLIHVGNMRIAAPSYCFSSSQSPSLVAVIRWMMRDILIQ
ncbi:Serine_palmitoyltransferase 1 [Hexamita inflata]|uniref:Serine palmitoyltransferase 1 n=1 Tax=Hexamita inflata TaxID=28002 RepID=A0AA86NRD2_9EUKA|nr:Serine palmitoyltransferase 1 [Hexamita inflata]